MTDRLTSLRKILVENNLDCAFITSEQNVFYLSGFTGYGDAYLIITEDKRVILTDPRYLVQAKEECKDFEVRNIAISEYQKIADLFKELKVNKVGFEDYSISYMVYNKISELTPFCVLEKLGGLIDDLRCIKSKDELNIIQEACDIACDAFNEVIGFIKEGITESDIAAEIEYRLKKKGAIKTSFDTIVASGLRGALPHGVASNKKICSSEAITMDFGAFYKGYCSDITRTVFMGEPVKKMRNIYEIVLNANRTAINSFKPGMTGKDLDLIAREYIVDNGYGNEFSHGLGHGVGVKVHEEPRVNRFGNKELIEGMIFSVEPGIYIEGFGGVRIEDLVTPVNGKLKILTEKASKELICL